MAAVRYVERNPVRAGMVEKASDYKWSSARMHCGLAYDSLLEGARPPPGLIPNWDEWLAGDDDKTAEETIRKSTSTGRPCGADSFVESIEQQTHRNFQRKRPGRKRRIEPVDSSMSLWPEEQGGN